MSRDADTHGDILGLSLDQSDFETCQQDKDCKVARATCGWPAAINKRTAKCFERYSEIMGRNLRCLTYDGPFDSLSAKCVENRCVLADR